MTLRTLPQDFEVEERCNPAWLAALATEWSPGRPHAVFRLSKSGLSTPDALAQLARALGLPARAASYAGLKDRHAVTGQTVSVLVSGSPPARRLPREPSGAQWRARLLGWSEAPVDASVIHRNDFVVVVRRLSVGAAAAMQSNAALLASSAGDLLAVNYFGDQRFGSARHGKGFAALPLIKGDFPEAIRLLVGTPARKDHGARRTFTRLCAQHWGDWKRLATALPATSERAAIQALAAGAEPAHAFQRLPNFLQMICIEAFQSLLWNRTARGMVDALGAPALEASDDFGAMRFPHAKRFPGEWLDLGVPMLAPGVELQPPWGSAAEAALGEFGLRLGDLRVPGLERPFFGSALRPLVARVMGFTMDAPQHDERAGGDALRRTVRFSLPRGAYATVVLRALGQ